MRSWGAMYVWNADHELRELVALVLDGIVKFAVEQQRQESCDTACMTIDNAAPSYRGFRFPAEIIQHAVWLYHRFSLSFRDVEELLFARGVTVTYETVRQWCRKFGQTFANQLRRRRARPGDKWHLDEVFLKINEYSP